ncbi:hypothetical protein IFM89_025386 [Coptis chinensis]|uniref:Uncharacterized protein n=1 Tax=Coptis chinensis TaxID=261450 RepID=A0A835HPV2_9MAGN|nr:hypothetical protein IFM89_025386 [Coptis chinensis]
MKKDYRLKKQRIHARLWMKEIEKQEEVKLGGSGGDDIERLLDSCSEIFVVRPWSTTVEEYRRVEIGEGNIVDIGLDYEWIPNKCSFCKAFRHSDARCLKNPTTPKPAPQKKQAKKPPSANLTTATESSIVSIPPSSVLNIQTTEERVPVAIITTKSGEENVMGIPQDSNPFSALVELEDEDNDRIDSSTEYQNALEEPHFAEDTFSEPGRLVIDLKSYKLATPLANSLFKMLPNQQPSHDDQALDIVLAKSPEDSTSHDHSMVIFNEKVDALTDTNASEDLSFMKPQDLNSAELYNFLNAKEHHDSC